MTGVSAAQAPTVQWQHPEQFCVTLDFGLCHGHGCEHCLSPRLGWQSASRRVWSLWWQVQNMGRGCHLYHVPVATSLFWLLSYLHIFPPALKTISFYIFLIWQWHSFFQILKCLTRFWGSQKYLSLRWQTLKWPSPWHLFNTHLPYFINLKVYFQCLWNQGEFSNWGQSDVSLKTVLLLEHCASFILLLNKSLHTYCLKTIGICHLRILGSQVWSGPHWANIKVSLGLCSCMEGPVRNSALPFLVSKGCPLLGSWKSHQGNNGFSQSLNHYVCKFI